MAFLEGLRREVFRRAGLAFYYVWAGLLGFFRAVWEFLAEAMT